MHQHTNPKHYQLADSSFDIPFIGTRHQSTTNFMFICPFCCHLQVKCIGCAKVIIININIININIININININIININIINININIINVLVQDNTQS